MNIALCTDENFSIPALVCITSIFENNRGDECHIYILTDGLSYKTKTKFDLLSQTYNQPIDIISIDKGRFKGLRVNERFPVSMYYRFLLPEMLPNENKVLYLDCDIIVRHSLKEMYNTNISDTAMAVVVGESTDDIVWENSLKLKSKYFNSGVLLMNLDYWRKYNVMYSLIDFVRDNPDKCILPDQDALNKVLEDKVIYLDYTYNFQEWWFMDMTHWMHYSKWDEIKKTGNDPAIVHFCEAEKPWFRECKNPFQNEFLQYANMHDFIGFHLKSRYGFEYKCADIIDRIGLKFRYWAEKWKKNYFRNIKIS